MSLLLKIEVIGFFGILLLQMIWGIRGELTEKRFTILPILSLNLIVITAGLEAYSSSPYPLGLVLLSVGTVFSAIMEYLLIRLVYRLSFRPK